MSTSQTVSLKMQRGIADSETCRRQEARAGVHIKEASASLPAVVSAATFPEACRHSHTTCWSSFVAFVSASSRNYLKARCSQSGQL